MSPGGRKKKNQSWWRTTALNQILNKYIRFSGQIFLHISQKSSVNFHAMIQKATQTKHIRQRKSRFYFIDRITNLPNTVNVMVFYIKFKQKMMGPGFVPWHVKLEYYFYCHCTNLTNCTEVKMCCYSPKQGNKDSIVFGAEHLLVSHTYSHNHVILGCLYLI